MRAKPRLSPTLTILRGYHPLKDAVFGGVAEVARAQFGAQSQTIQAIGVQMRGYSETRARADVAMMRAKRRARGLVKPMKRALIAGQYNWARAQFAPGDLALCWNGLTGSRMAFMQGARDAGAARLFAELAPFKGYVTLDPEGLNAESSVPRQKSALGDQPLSPARAKDLANALTARAGRVGQEAGVLPDAPFLFCPLQVPNDSQITVFAGWAQSVQNFIVAVTQSAQSLPEGWHIRLKEHPSSKVSLTALLRWAEAIAPGRIILDNRTDTFAQIRASKGVITINSSLALESFLLDRPVIVTGDAYFAQPGLVTPARSQEELTHFCAAPDALAFDQQHRMALLGYLLDDYFVPMDGTKLDQSRTKAKLKEAWGC